jgi:ribosome-associated protein
MEYWYPHNELEQELVFTASRSSGPGGQNVNKVNTRIELRFNVMASAVLTDFQKQKVMLALQNRINSEGELIIVSQSERSQLKNKQQSIERFHQLIELAIKPVKKRKKTRPTLSSVEKRLSLKKRLSEKKSFRGRIL